MRRPSWLSTVTVAPGLAEAGVEKLKFLIVMVDAVLPGAEGPEDEAEAEDDDAEDDEEPVVVPEDDEPDEPQPTRASAHRPARISRAGAWVPDMSRPLRGPMGASSRPAAASRRRTGNGSGVATTRRHSPARRRAVAVRPAARTQERALAAVALRSRASSRTRAKSSSVKTPLTPEIAASFMPCLRPSR